MITNRIILNFKKRIFKKHTIIFQSTPAVNSSKFTRVYSHKDSEALLFNYIPSIIYEHLYKFENIFHYIQTLKI